MNIRSFLIFLSGLIVLCILTSRAPYREKVEVIEEEPNFYTVRVYSILPHSQEKVQRPLEGRYLEMAEAAVLRLEQKRGRCGTKILIITPVKLPNGTITILSDYMIVLFQEEDVPAPVQPVPDNAL